MFQMYPGALETESRRRRELALATMRAVHVNRVRHVIMALATALAGAA